jgi:hypothetical protein
MGGIMKTEFSLQGVKASIIGLIIGFSIAGNIYGYMLHNGAVVSVKAACGEYVETGDIVSHLERGKR